MEVVYEPSIIDKIAEAKERAAELDKTIREIILTMDEWKELLRASSRYILGEPGELKTVLGIRILPACYSRNTLGYKCGAPYNSSQCDNCSCRP